MDVDALKQKIKQSIISECDKEDEFEWHEIEDDEPLFGKDSRIELDSLDALQLALVLKQDFGLQVEGSKDSRKHLQSVNTMIALIQSKQGE